jgi:hypothetical protein
MTTSFSVRILYPEIRRYYIYTIYIEEFKENTLIFSYGEAASFQIFTNPLFRSIFPSCSTPFRTALLNGLRINFPHRKHGLYLELHK